MINKDNLAALLLTLEFEADNNVYSKHFPNGDFYLRIDFNKQEIIYPEEKGFTINERQTCDFSKNENFVVFECVHRLLMKGYKPEHIELERKWKSGHSASGGRADILVKNQQDKPLLIIECKTAGKEFDKAWRDTQQNGAQLLTYADRERTVNYVCLYASDFIDNQVAYENYIIVLADVQNLVEQYAAKEIKPLFYKDITDVKQWYQVWNETYNREYLTTGIFDENVQAYNIGQEKLSIKDLKYITGREMQGKYHEFAEILRKFSVSSKESAFDKLINLFLCKIVDENQAHHNGKDLEFNWRGNYADDYFSLIDRLQKLYRDGMEEYLGEKITYIDNQKVMEAFGYYRDRNATRDYVLQLFKQQKYFTNSDFGFIDVHNDKLFYQNAEILLSVVKMWQQFQLNGEQQNQFLGDMFEGFLDKGFKQSEGQYFTPIPICKFILSALPLEQKLYENEKPPRVIDYACGSGHFLTEYATQIYPIIEEANAQLQNPAYQRNIKDYYKNIFGVEKEYRLSKVAKMSAFMYGQDEINVIYCDALKNIQQEIRGQGVLVEEETCDILTANPPFAVDGFLSTLTQNERENYTLFNHNLDITTQRNIQCFFLERAKQLLKGNGVAGIIVPSSVLSNSDSMHIATREILLQYFDFVSIVELGSNTFGKTGTNTVVLFLRRKAQRPEPALHYWNRTLDFFDKWNDEQQTNGSPYVDINTVKKYCQHIDIPFDDYQYLLKGSIDAIYSILVAQYDLFKDYKANFDSLNEIKKLREAKQFKAKSPSEQQTELNKRFIKYLREIEQQKLYYFILAKNNPQTVLLVKSPSDNKAQKQFLGYEWSGSKGSEGIKYNGGDTIHDIITPMFDPKDRKKPDKISYYIRQNFQGLPLSIPEHLQAFMTQAHLEDLLDFSRKDFNKAFSLTPKTTTTTISKWELVKLGEVAEVKKGKSITQKDTQEGNIKVVAGGIDFAYLHNEANRPENTITISASGANAGFVNFWREPIFASDCTTVLGKTEIETFYFLNILKHLQEEIYAMARGSAQPHVYPKDIAQLKIPLPPLSVQQQIVTECEAIDAAVENAKIAIAAAKAEIEGKVKAVFGNYTEQRIADIAHINPSKTEIKNIDEDTLISFIEMASVSEKGFIADKIDKPLKDLKKGSYTYFAENDLIIAKITPCMENGKCAIAIGLTNGLAMGSSEFHVFRAKDEVLNKYLFALLNRDVIRKEAEMNFTGSSGHRRVPASFYENYKIPVPPLAVQEQLVSEIAVLEAQIAHAETIIQESAAQKQAVMKRYL
jgi:type I restriction enzyme M protein